MSVMYGSNKHRLFWAAIYGFKVRIYWCISGNFLEAIRSWQIISWLYPDNHLPIGPCFFGIYEVLTLGSITVHLIINAPPTFDHIELFAVLTFFKHKTRRNGFIHKTKLFILYFVWIWQNDWIEAYHFSSLVYRLFFFIFLRYLLQPLSRLLDIHHQSN